MPSSAAISSIDFFVIFESSALLGSLLTFTAGAGSETLPPPLDDSLSLFPKNLYATNPAITTNTTIPINDDSMVYLLINNLLSKFSNRSYLSGCVG